MCLVYAAQMWLEGSTADKRGGADVEAQHKCEVAFIVINETNEMNLNQLRLINNKYFNAYLILLSGLAGQPDRPDPSLTFGNPALSANLMSFG